MCLFLIISLNKNQPRIPFLTKHLGWVLVKWSLVETKSGNLKGSLFLYLGFFVLFTLLRCIISSNVRITNDAKANCACRWNKLSNDVILIFSFRPDLALWNFSKTRKKPRIFLVRIFPHLDWIQRDTEYIQSECGKIRTRITPNTDTFYVVQ